MPIEIRELVIKATVQKPLGGGQSSSLTQNEIARLKREILDACREEMKDLLEQKDHR